MHGTSSTTPRALAFALTSCAAVVAVAVVAVAFAPGRLQAQEFGQNKVTYRNFDFRQMHTRHFDVYYYPAESLAVADMARMAERWYERHSESLRDTFSRKPIIIYSDGPAFAQNNIAPQFVGGSIGGFTEPSRDRAVLPMSGDYASNDHILGHELVHVFQFDIAGAFRGGFSNMNRMPQWSIEGMAEYLSIGRDDPNTVMFLRDQALRNKLPTFKKLVTDPQGYFAYRWGQALYAYIGGRYGDVEIPAIYRAGLRRGIEPAIREVLGITPDSLMKEWEASFKATYLVDAKTRTLPKNLGTRLLEPTSKKYGDIDLAPSLSPDGKEVAFITGRGLFSLYLYIADATTGKILHKLTSPNGDPHFEAVNFVSSSGAWSPDGKKLAVVAFTGGGVDMVIYDVASGHQEKRIRVPGIGMINGIAWGPDGQLAFSGMAGGLSNLYLHHLATGQTEKLTDGRYARLEPTWSPDGHSLAYVTDSAPGTNFDQLVYSPMQVAVMDMTSPTHATQVLQLFTGKAKNINPQYSPDGQSLYFISDQDGYSDVYKLELASGQIVRSTRVATGITGILPGRASSGASPAMSVATETGRMMVNVFEQTGYSLHRIEPDQLLGIPTSPQSPDSTGGTAIAQGIIPPPNPPAGNAVTERIDDPETGLPSEKEFPNSPYHATLALDGIGTAGVGIAFGGPEGTGAAGGVAFQFGDELENNIVAASVQASGYLQDIGGQVVYLNQTHRWNYGVALSHIPYLQLGEFSYDSTIVNPGGSQTPAQVLEEEYLRTYYESAQLFAQYPFSQTRRIELGGGFTYLHYGITADKFLILPDGSLDQIASNQGLPTPPGLDLFNGTAAFVGDYATFGFTSPVAGSRYRFEADPTFGSLTYTGITADYRRYFLVNPVTFAFRLFHYGRYGPGGDDPRLSQIYVGDPYFVRGYDVNSFTASECSALVSGTGSCPLLTRLLGSRIAVINAEMRIPLLGVSQYGLINFPYLPTEIAPFFDGGMAWTSTSHPVLTLNPNTTGDAPVFSAGVSARFNILGYIVAEVYYAVPFQRPGVGGQFGFQILPGW
jgi:Tol biopolymer transport system component/glutaredoxin-related protein